MSPWYDEKGSWRPRHPLAARAPDALLLWLAVAAASPLLDACRAEDEPETMYDLPRISSGVPPVQLVTSGATCPLGPLVASIDPTLFGKMAFGDSDNDGRNEVVLYVNDEGVLHYRFLEEQGANSYVSVQDGPSLLPYVVGDLDMDGKSELIGQGGTAAIQVYESVNPRKHPTNLVWSSPSLSSIIGETTSGDTDSDGRLEIIHSVNSFAGNSALVIYENTGNDQFEEVFWGVVPSNQSNGEKVIADLDLDGRIEIAFSGGHGHLHVYESGGDNQWQHVWTTSTGMINAYGAAGGVDTDGNGRPELFVMGEMGGLARTFVFEAFTDNSFAAVDTITHIGIGYTNALGDWTGDGLDEYVSRVTPNVISFYASQSPGNWQEIECFCGADSSHSEIFMFDANRNGRDELFWAFSGPILNINYSWIFEKPITSDSETYEVTLPHLRFHPNPTRGLAYGIGPPALSPFDMLLYDVSGRLVQRSRIRQAGGFVLDGSSLAAGVYVVRLLDDHGRHQAQGRVAILH